MSIKEALSTENHLYVQRTFQQFRKGTRESFNEIYNYHYERILLFVERLIQDPEEAQDITVDTFTKLWQHRQTIKDFASIKPFLYAVARNSCFDYLRRIKTKQFHHAQIMKLQDVLEDRHTDEATQSSLSIIYAEVMENIIKEIESLPPVRKAVFKMIFLEEKSTQEVAKALDISPQTVLNHKNHALNYLRNWVKSQNDLLLLSAFELLIHHFS